MSEYHPRDTGGQFICCINVLRIAHHAAQRAVKALNALKAQNHLITFSIMSRKWHCRLMNAAAWRLTWLSLGTSGSGRSFGGAIVKL